MISHIFGIKHVFLNKFVIFAHGPWAHGPCLAQGPWAMGHGPWSVWCCPWLRTWPRGLAHSPGPLCPAHCARRIVPGPWAWPISLAHAWARPIWPRPVVPAPLCPPHCARPIGPGPLGLVHSARPTGPRPIDELWLHYLPLIVANLQLMGPNCG